MRLAWIAILAIAVLPAAAFAQSSRPSGPTMCACPNKPHQQLGSHADCYAACGISRPGSGSRPAPVHTPPAIDHEAQRRAREAEAQAERERQAAEERRRKEEAERQARFIRDRDAAASTLRGSIGTSASPNSPGGTPLRGSGDVEIGRQLRGTAEQPDLGGKQAAWKQLHCAASILSPALVALDRADYAEFRFLADEAANALNGQRLRVSCAPAPEMPQSRRPASAQAQEAKTQAQLVARTRELATKLEDGRRKQEQAQAVIRGTTASAANAAAADVVEEQRRINRSRDEAAKQMAKAQRDFSEGKRSEESAKRELKKIQEKVESVVRGDRIAFDEEAPVASRQEKK